jgi:hypothetical protein
LGTALLLSITTRTTTFCSPEANLGAGGGPILAAAAAAAGVETTPPGRALPAVTPKWSLLLWGAATTTTMRASLILPTLQPCAQPKPGRTLLENEEEEEEEGPKVKGAAVEGQEWGLVVVVVMEVHVHLLEVGAAVGGCFQVRQYGISSSSNTSR